MPWTVGMQKPTNLAEANLTAARRVSLPGQTFRPGSSGDAPVFHNTLIVFNPGDTGFLRRVNATVSALRF